MRSVLEQPGEGRVLVVDGGASLRVALLGDRIAGLAVIGGWNGIVINGAVRDVTALGSLDIGVKALGSNPRRSSKTGAGEADVPFSFGGVSFVPGEYLVADDDGIVVLGGPPRALTREAGAEALDAPPPPGGLPSQNRSSPG